MTAVSRHLVCLGVLFYTLPAMPFFAESKPSNEAKSERLPPGWEGSAPRDEIRPTFSYDPKGGRKSGGAFVIVTGDSVAEHGWFRKAFAVTGGKSYRFSAVRRTENVAVPRRSAIVRIVWQDDDGKAVKADVP